MFLPADSQMHDAPLDFSSTYVCTNVKLTQTQRLPSGSPVPCMPNLTYMAVLRDSPYASTDKVKTPAHHRCGVPGIPRPRPSRSATETDARPGSRF